MIVSFIVCSSLIETHSQKTDYNLHLKANQEQRDAKMLMNKYIIHNWSVNEHEKSLLSTTVFHSSSMENECIACSVKQWFTYVWTIMMMTMMIHFRLIKRRRTTTMTTTNVSLRNTDTFNKYHHSMNYDTTVYALKLMLWIDARFIV